LNWGHKIDCIERRRPYFGGEGVLGKKIDERGRDGAVMRPVGLSHFQLSFGDLSSGLRRSGKP